MGILNILSKLARVQAPNYIVRKLDVTKTSETNLSGEHSNRVVVHLQLTDWPDRSTPGTGSDLVTIVQLTHVLLTTHSLGPDTGPLLVHCSAGVGRTGTFICVDQIMRQLDTVPCNELDIFHTVYQLRKQR